MITAIDVIADIECLRGIHAYEEGDEPPTNEACDGAIALVNELYQQIPNIRQFKVAASWDAGIDLYNFEKPSTIFHIESNKIAISIIHERETLFSYYGDLEHIDFQAIKEIYA